MHKQKQQNSMVQKPTKTLQPTNRIQPMQKLSTKTSNQNKHRKNKPDHTGKNRTKKQPPLPIRDKNRKMRHLQSHQKKSFF